MICFRGGQADWIAAPLRTFHVHNKSAGREKSYGGFTLPG